MNTADRIRALEDQVLSGKEIAFEDGLFLMELQQKDLFQLYASANNIRSRFCGDKVYLCAITNAKSGACSEDCSFCAQSARHPTAIETYSLQDTEAILNASRTAATNGASSFGIVTAWKGIKKGKTLDKIIESIKAIKADGKVVPDLSLGLIDDPEVAFMLAEAGAEEYNHNLETAKSFYPTICKSHAWEERYRTLEYARAAGMRVCSGGIFGLGESLRQRVELAFELKPLQANNTPLNFYHHIEGNAVDIQKVGRLSALQALQIVAVFRFILPHTILKIAGGRETTLGDFQELMFMTGANSTMIGHYLTTQGRNPEDDFDLINRSGLSVSEKGCVLPQPALSR